MTKFIDKGCDLICLWGGTSTEPHQEIGEPNCHHDHSDENSNNPKPNYSVGPRFHRVRFRSDRLYNRNVCDLARVMFRRCVCESAREVTWLGWLRICLRFCRQICFRSKQRFIGMIFGCCFWGGCCCDDNRLYGNIWTNRNFA